MIALEEYSEETNCLFLGKVLYYSQNQTQVMDPKDEVILHVLEKNSKLSREIPIINFLVAFFE